MLAQGVIVGGYRIERVIDRGGMGVVYEAWDDELEIPVAIKVIAVDLSADQSFRERFRREGRVQARIQHPHIIPVYRMGESEHGLYLAMQLVRGRNLYDLIKDGELDEQRTLRLMTQVADALDAAHEVGLIHRDIKPQNVLVEPRRDHAFLADFGITKAQNMSHLTMTGSIVGTPDYMSPEQIIGKTPTTRSDIYSLGAVVFECFTGTVPYPRDTGVATLFAHVNEPPPSLAEHRPDLPPEAGAVITRAMAKEPEERQATASELMAELQGSLAAWLAAAAATSAPPAAAAATPAAVTLASDTDVVEVEPEEPAAETVVHEPAPATEEQPAGEATQLATPADKTVVAEPVEETVAPEPEPVEEAEDAAAATVLAERAAETVIPEEPAPADETVLRRPEPVADETVLAPRRPTEPAVPAGAAAASGATAPLQAPPAPAPDPDATTIAPSRSGPIRPPETTEVLEPHRPTAPIAAPAPTGRRTGALVGGAVLLAAGVIGAGFLLGRSTAGDEEVAPPAVPTGPGTASSGQLELSYSDPWRPQSQATRIPGLELRQPVGLAPAGAAGVGLVAGGMTPAWPTFLPPQFRALLPGGDAPRPEIVRIQGRDAFRYQNLKPRGFGGSTTVYVLPQTGSATAIACYAKGGAAVPAGCSGIAATAAVAGAKPYPLVVPPAYAAAVNGAVKSLDAARKKGLEGLEAAKTPAEQAKAARAVADACRSSLTKLRSADPTPFVRPAHTDLTVALRGTCAAYEKLAAAAGPSGSDQRYAQASRALQQSEQRLTEAVAGLEQVGFSVS